MTRKRSVLHEAPVLHGMGALPSSLRRVSPRPVRWLAGLCTGLLVVGAAFANPIGPDVVHGSARLTHPGPDTLHVTTSPGTVINWQGFSIGADEVTRFIQPSAASAVLNRVTGADPSAILGRLLSNGRVFLVNPHGIVFGEGSVVDTAGLVASTLDIGDADFRAGRYRFDAGPEAGAIVNQGLIKAGADGVFLLAPSVESSGVIRTAGGDLVLAAGRRITLTSLDLDGVRVEVQAPEDEALNLGALIAERGAAGVFAGSLRNTGTVEASAVEVGEDGVVRLVAQGDVTLEAGGRVAAEGRSGGTVHIESEGGTTWVSGEVSARGSEGRGGAIRLLGERVGLAGARVDASGPAGGGEVLVGGDVSGEGPVPRAGATYVSADSTVSADALGAGDGGKVVVFAEGFANVQGRLSARGGPHGGDGGFVETSGLGSFAIGHTPDTTAPGGEGGHWLIDPNDIEIVAGGGNVNINAANPFASTDDSAQLGIDLLVAALSGGQSVTVQTAESGANSQTGDITLSTPFDVESTTGTNTLTLDAHRNIVLDQAITDTADGAELNLVLDAQSGVHVEADVTLRGGSLTTNGGFVIISDGAHVTVDGITWHMNANYVDIGASDGAGGTVTVQNGGALDATGHEVKVYGSGAGVGTLNVETGAKVTAYRVLIGGLDKGASGTVKVTGSGSTLTTKGANNLITVGDEETGTLEVLDGGLVETYALFVGLGAGGSAVGRATIRGVASDNTRSRVIVSPDHGKSSLSPDEGGFVQVGGHADSQGTLEILEGGLFRVRDGDDGGGGGGTTLGPRFTVARNKGSVGVLRVDGKDSSLEVIQNGVVDSTVVGFFGPRVWLGRRGGGTTTIRNGGRLLVRGERSFVGISRDSVEPISPDPDPSPIDQQSVVNVLSGGAIEVDGESATFRIGNLGPAADGKVTVSGSGSRLTTKGTDNDIRVGVSSGTGTLEVLDGGLVETLMLDVGNGGIGRVVIRGVAADATRSRMIVSPVGGKFSQTPTRGGYVLVGISADGQGTLEILEGGLLQVRDGQDTHGPSLAVARNADSTGMLLIDGSGSSLEVIQDSPAVPGNLQVAPGPEVWLGLGGLPGGGTTTIRNGGRLLAQGEQAFVGVRHSVVNILSGGTMEVDGKRAAFTIDNSDPAAAGDGRVTVSGSGSKLTTKGTDNYIEVGLVRTGTLEVLDGGLVETLMLDVGRAGIGRVVIRGVAADATRSRVIVSPANGKFSGRSQGGRVWAGTNGGQGTLEILEGGLLQVRDGRDTHGPELRVAYSRGSTGTLLVDGSGSSLEVIQDSPAVSGNPDVTPGPRVWLGRRGGGTTTIRNGGRLRVQGEEALVRISDSPDPIAQQSVVNLHSGGRLEADGEGAWLVIGDGGSAADGAVTVTGSDSTLTTTGSGNGIAVGDEGTGALTIGSGGIVRAERVIVGRRPGSQGTLMVESGGELEAGMLLAVGKDFDTDTLTTQEPGGTGSAMGEAGSRARYDALEVGAGGSTNLKPPLEELPSEVQEDVDENANEILPVSPQEDEEGEQDEEAGEETVAGESGEDEREELPMCPA